MLDASLLIFFTLFIIISARYILKRNVLFGGVYVFLFVYSIFAQIGYCFFPALSVFAKAYFGPEYFYKFYCFNFLSFLSFWILFKFTFPYLKKIKKYEIVKSKVSDITIFLFFSFIVSNFLYLFIFYLRNKNIINYDNASDVDFMNSQGFPYRLFSMLFKTMVLISLMLYAQLRLKTHFTGISNYTKSIHIFLTILYIPFFIFLANILGSRTDILALFIGIIVLEFKIGLNFKKIISFLIIGFCVFSMLLYIEKNRINDYNDDSVFIEKILQKDYYAPAHMLYAAMGNNYIHPLEVITSNIGNTFFKLNQPYLQQPITDIINPGIATRSAGYAFYLFTEGFIFMGYSGFIYNALMLMVGLSLWYYIQNSTNKYYNYIILAYMCTQFANIARTQSSLFYKDIYMSFLPLIILIYLSSGLRPKLKLKLR